MFVKVKTILAGAALVLVSNQANAVVYSGGQNAAGSSVVTSTVSTVTTQAGVTNVLAHTANLITSLVAPVPVTPSAPVAPAPAPVGGPAPAPSGTPAPGGDNTSSLLGGNKTVALFDTSQQKGYNAGDDKRNVSVWGNASFTWVESDAANANFDGDVGALNIGIDKWFNEKFLAGLSVGYAKTDVTTTFNNGNYEEDSFTVSPYGVLRVTDNIAVTGMFGHTWSDVDQNRQAGATTASTDAETWFGSGLVSYEQYMDRLGVKGRVGYLWASRDTDGFVESDSNVVAATTAETSQLRFGGEASYLFGLSNVNLTPYASVDYLYDFEDEINNDADAFDTGLGLRISAKDGSIDGVFSVNTQLGRSDFESTTASATLRFNF